MATTNSAFVKLTNAVLTGATVGSAGDARATFEQNAIPLVSGSYATRLDAAPNANLATAGFALNGAYVKTLSGTTAVNPDLTDLTSGATSYAGDTTFAKVFELIVYNTGAADITVAPGGSNPFTIGLNGTTPTLTVKAGDKVAIGYGTTGITVDSTHKVITITPTAGGSVALVVGGA